MTEQEAHCEGEQSKHAFHLHLLHDDATIAVGSWGIVVYLRGEVLSASFVRYVPNRDEWLHRPGQLEVRSRITQR
jgi:hypothetical protein